MFGGNLATRKTLRAMMQTLSLHDPAMDISMHMGPASDATFSPASDFEEYRDSEWSTVFEVGMQVRRKARLTLAKMAKEGTVGPAQVSNVWISHYNVDRLARIRKRELRMTAPQHDGRRIDQVYDRHRPTTPFRRRRAINPHTNEEEQPARYEEVVGETMSKEEYANYRRGYETKLIMEENRRRVQRGEEELDEFPMHDLRVDAICPLEKIAQRVDYGAKDMLDYYYEVSAGNLYILRVDVVANYDPSSSSSSSSPSSSIAGVVRPREEGGGGGDDDGDDTSSSKRQQQSATPFQSSIPTSPVPVPVGGDWRTSGDDDGKEVEEAARVDLEQNYFVLPMPDRHADGLYHSVAILLSLQNETQSSSSVPSSMVPPSFLSPYKLRTEAMKWMLAKDGPGFKLVREKVTNDNVPMFVRFLLGQRLSDADEMSSQRLLNYDLGMVRARITMMYDRQKERKPPFTQWSGDPTEQSPNAESSLLSEYCTSQRNAHNWPTMFDVHALANALKRTIHLYYNSGDVEQKTGGGVVSQWQDWQLYPPKVIDGTGIAGSRNVGVVAAEPIRLLWSADQTMRFRPIVPKGVLESDDAYVNRRDTLRDRTLLSSRDDRREWLFSNVSTCYYSTDVWEQRYNA